MTTRLSDNREAQAMTVAEADQMFARIAVLSAQITRSAAMTDKQIADLKASHEQRTAIAQDELNELTACLNDYITSNKARFLKPRQRKTAFGKYGLRTVSETRIIDPEAVIAYSDGHELALYDVKRTVNKKAVEKQIADGETIPGAKILTGDVASFTVAKDVLDQPVKK